jgi:hypothetical protein
MSSRPSRSVSAAWSVVALLALFVAACSSPNPGSSSLAGGDAVTDAKTDATVKKDGSDAKDGATEDDLGDPDAATDDDVPEPDVADAATDVEEKDIDFSELLDDPDAIEPDTGPVSTGPVGQLYAHTKDTLFQLDLKAGAFVQIGKFTFDKSSDLVTDIAVEATGKLYAVTYKDVFVCDIASAACKWLAKLSGTSTFNGLTFVPKGTVDPVSDALIGISEDGSWNHVQITGGTAKIVKLGDYGGKWLSSGDAFSVEGIGTYATLKGVGTTDSLALIDPKNGKATVIGETGAKGLFGLAWWSGVFYAFGSDGSVYTLDVGTGKATPVKGITLPAGAKWWGAGVSTRANGKPK